MVVWLVLVDAEEVELEVALDDVVVVEEVVSTLVEEESMTDVLDVVRDVSSDELVEEV